MRRRHAVGVALALAAIPMATGCAQMSEQAKSTELCAQYAELAVAADDLREQDLASAKVDDLRVKAEQFQADLDQLQAVSEGRLDTAISTLRAGLADFKQAAVDAGEDALATAQPLLEDSIDQISEAWAVLEESVNVQCNAG